MLGTLCSLVRNVFELLAFYSIPYSCFYDGLCDRICVVASELEFCYIICVSVINITSLRNYQCLYLSNYYSQTSILIKKLHQKNGQSFSLAHVGLRLHRLVAMDTFFSLFSENNYEY